MTDTSSSIEEANGRREKPKKKQKKRELPNTAANELKKSEDLVKQLEESQDASQSEVCQRNS